VSNEKFKQVSENMKFYISVSILLQCNTRLSSLVSKIVLNLRHTLRGRYKKFSVYYGIHKYAFKFSSHWSPLKTNTYKIEHYVYAKHWKNHITICLCRFYQKVLSSSWTEHRMSQSPNIKLKSGARCAKFNILHVLLCT
jgi:hypothetical protein